MPQASTAGKGGSLAGRVSAARTWATHIPAAHGIEWGGAEIRSRAMLLELWIRGTKSAEETRSVHPKRSLNSSVIRRHVGF